MTLWLIPLLLPHLTSGLPRSGNLSTIIEELHLKMPEHFARGASNGPSILATNQMVEHLSDLIPACLALQVRNPQYPPHRLLQDVDAKLL